MNIIEDWREKIKATRTWLMEHERDLAICLILVLSSFLSYGLGRLSNIESLTPPVTVTSSSSIELLSAVTAVSERKITASKKGTKYYLPWCGGSRTIKPENRISFDNEKEAQGAGYSLAGNCQSKP